MYKKQEINMLYIEDDDSVAKLIMQYLKSDHHTIFNVTHKKTLQESIEYLENTNVDNIDIILMDLILPNSRGIDTYLKVRETSQDLPIVIISAHEDLACKCVRLGAQDYLIKTSLSAGLLTRSLKYSIERTKLKCKYENIIQTSSLGYHLYERIDGRLILTGYNKTANKILKIDNKDLLNKEISEAFPNLSQELLDGYMAAINGTPYVRQIVEYEDVNIKHAYFIVSAYKSAKDQLAVTFEDITEKIKTQNNLKESENKFRHLVEVTKAGMYEIDFIADRITYANDVVCNKSGYTREELMNMSPMDILSKDSVEKWIQRRESLGKGEYIHGSTEYKIIKKNGNVLWVLITAEYIEDIDKNIIGANVVAIDITDRKVMEARLQEQEEKVYSELENKISRWREESRKKTIEQDQQLSAINGKIISMVSIGEVM